VRPLQLRGGWFWGGCSFCDGSYCGHDGGRHLRVFLSGWFWGGYSFCGGSYCYHDGGRHLRVFLDGPPHCEKVEGIVASPAVCSCFPVSSVLAVLAVVCFFRFSCHATSLKLIYVPPPTPLSVVLLQAWVAEALSAMVAESLKLDKNDYPTFKMFGGSDRLFAGKSYLRDATFSRKKKLYKFPTRYTKSGKGKYETLHKMMMVRSMK
jgi:hypothetical protein